MLHWHDLKPKVAAYIYIPVLIVKSPDVVVLVIPPTLAFTVVVKVEVPVFRIVMNEYNLSIR